EVGGDALETADRDRILLHATAPAGGLAGTVAGSAEHAGKDVRLPIDHVGVAVAARRDQPDIFGDWCVGWARPLAIDFFVRVVRARNVSLFHSLRAPAP